MKISDFGVQIPVNPPTFDDKSLTLSIKASVTSAEELDGEILKEIVRIAKEDGTNYLFVLDKTNIKNALMKASAKKVYNVSGYKTIKACPTCSHELIYGSKYCDQCGQKLDWTGEYMD